MKTYNFQARFAPMLESDLKLTTIRRLGKRPPPEPGELIRRYTGMRTKHCRFLGDRICRSVHRLRIDSRGQIFFGRERLVGFSRVVLAAGDGFDSTQEFIEFFRKVHGLPFKGWYIQWRRRSQL
jgi:hypothetical protein